ncbi:hypothetical protein AHAS_Ahas03G0293500 [Arachis hypogaea]
MLCRFVSPIAFAVLVHQLFGQLQMCGCVCWYVQSVKVQSVIGIGVLLYASSAKALRVMANVVSLFHNNHAVRERRGTCGSAAIGSGRCLGGIIYGKW